MFADSKTRTKKSREYERFRTGNNDKSSFTVRLLLLYTPYNMSFYFGSICLLKSLHPVKISEVIHLRSLMPKCENLWPRRQLVMMFSEKLGSNRNFPASTVIHRNKTPWITNLLEKGSYFDTFLFLAGFAGPSRYGFSKLVSLF